MSHCKCSSTLSFGSTITPTLSDEPVKELTTKREHIKMKCPFCNWNKRSFNLPGHLVTWHIDQLYTDPINFNTFLCANFVDKTRKISFCVCLSCKKGIMAHGMSSAGGRWGTKHSKECLNEHNAQLIKIQGGIKSFVELPATEEPATEEPATEEPATEEPATEEPATEEPATEEPATDPPVTQEPPATPDPPATQEQVGYVYCFSNESMPGIFKIGMTRRTPEERLKEANLQDTWKPPTSYKIEMSKFVKNPKKKERLIHSLLSKFTERIHNRREFFRVGVEDVKMLFDLME